MVRVWSENPPNYSVNEIRQACEGWASRYDETLTTEKLTITHATGGDEDSDFTEHLTGHWRFSWSENHTILLDDLETDLQEYVDWSRIKYHECESFNESGVENPTPCSWDETETREFGTVPL